MSFTPHAYHDRHSHKVKFRGAARIEELESKVDQLVKILTATSAYPDNAGGHYNSDLGEAQLNGTISAHSTCAQSEYAPYLSRQMCSSEGSGSHAARTLTSNTSDCRSEIELHNTSTVDHISSAIPSNEEAEALLDRFRRLMAPKFPFITISETMTVKRLQTTKPFLLYSIMTAAHFHDLQRQRIMFKNAIREMTNRVYINEEKDLEIVEGILLLLAWIHPHTFWTQQTNNLLHTAAALAIDLSIDRPVDKCADWKGQEDDTSGETTAIPLNASTLAGTRVFAGLYYVSTILATSFRRQGTIQYSNHLKNNLHTMEMLQATPADLELLQLVRLQQVLDEAARVDISEIPVYFHVKALLEEVARIDANNACDGRSMTLQLQFLATTNGVLELALNQAQSSALGPTRQHFDLIFQLVRAASNFCSLWFSISVDSLLTYSFAIFNQLAHAIILLRRVLILNLPGLRCADSTEIGRFSEIIENAIHRFECIARSCPDGLSIRNDAFDYWAQRVRYMRSDLIKSNLLPLQAEPAQNSVPPSSSDLNPAAFDFFLMTDDQDWSSYLESADLSLSDLQMG